MNESAMAEELSRRMRRQIDDMALAALTGTPARVENEVRIAALPYMYEYRSGEKVVRGEVVEDEVKRLA